MDLHELVFSFFPRQSLPCHNGLPTDSKKQQQKKNTQKTITTIGRGYASHDLDHCDALDWPWKYYLYPAHHAWQNIDPNKNRPC